MCRSVADAALILNFIAGPDPRDEATLHQPGIVPDYMTALDKNALKGARIGVPRSALRGIKAVEETFNKSLDIFRDLGAEIVDPVDFPDVEEVWPSGMGDLVTGDLVMAVDLKLDINKYLSGLLDVPTGVRTLADLIEFNKTHADLELPPPFYKDQSQYVGSSCGDLLLKMCRFIESEATQVDDAYFAELAEHFDLGRTRGIDAVLAQFNLDAIILPTSRHASTPAAIAGYPLISG